MTSTQCSADLGFPVSATEKLREGGDVSASSMSLSADEFAAAAREFVSISESLDDGWRLCGDDDQVSPGGSSDDFSSAWPGGPGVSLP
ncbi:hypothetical protein BIW11_11941 [Tropilaelaps mercedesae]|uniref:Uncharacterized protein n=1 Tax=Tropilaelaps mercedesae TaxID=418985 RepID=A0A1V9X984_9ACAR|nr:hypothetical protein BIW11_11941 [Tropilaelaps mercedesae]